MVWATPTDYKLDRAATQEKEVLEKWFESPECEVACNELATIVDDISSGKGRYLVQQKELSVQGKNQSHFWVGKVGYDGIFDGLLRRLREDRGLTDRTREALHKIGLHLIFSRQGLDPWESSRLSGLRILAFAKTEGLNDDSSMPQLCWEPIDGGLVRLFYVFSGQLVGPLGDFETGSSWAELADKHRDGNRRETLLAVAAGIGAKESPASTDDLTELSEASSYPRTKSVASYTGASTHMTASNLVQPSNLSLTPAVSDAKGTVQQDLISWWNDEEGNPVFSDFDLHGKSVDSSKPAFSKG